MRSCSSRIPHAACTICGGTAVCMCPKIREIRFWISILIRFVFTMRAKILTIPGMFLKFSPITIGLLLVIVSTMAMRFDTLQ